MSRRAILEVRSGPLLGAKAIIAAGETLRIGRTERAHLVVPCDAQMSGLHCELHWDGEVCRLRDHSSAGGTTLAGVPVDGEAPVPHGSFLQAGATMFSVYYEAFTPPRAKRPASVEAARARALLDAEVGRLYAVLDTARDERILQLLHEGVDTHQSLYDGVKGDALADVAPYLVAFRRDSGLLGRVVAEGWGRSWGTFVVSAKSFKLVRRHFRRLLMVQDDASGARMYFRFYDPRVLREFMPIATPRQKDEIFEDLTELLVEGEQGEVVRWMAREMWPAVDAER